MIEIICGEKGKGKTKELLGKVNSSVTAASGNVVYLDKSQKCLQHWGVEAHETKQLITSLGTVTFEKTFFKNKETGKCEYLLD